MRFFALALTFVFFLTSCAQQGVIVEKETGPQPFYHSLGVDGSYAFLLRDASGVTHRQLVTAEVFELYAVGQYFNDLQPAPTPKEMSDGKTMLPTVQRIVPVLPPRTIKVRRTEKSARIAGRKHQARRRVAHATKRRARARQIVRRHDTLRVTKTAQPEFLVVSVVRCR